jgi:4,5-DOPA dioxygenase extradiol
MILASGNVVHNLRRLQWDQPDLAYDWAERFDDAVADQLAQAPGDALKVMEHGDYALAVPTPDHFVPLLYLAGVAAADGVRPEPLVRGYSMGSISMTCYGIGADVELRKHPTCAALLPAGVPPEETNM